MLTIRESRAIRSSLRCMIALIAMLAAVAHSSAHAAMAKAFASPEEAAREVVAAIKSGNTKELAAILGAEAKKIIDSGDPVADRDGRARFARAFEEASKLERSSDTRVIISVGKDAWPFPIPIVKDSVGWRFDAKAGQEEILNRRIGRNELSAIQAVQAYVDAQREYYLRNPQKDKLFQYAQRFVSTPGKRDGLYFLTKSGEQASPLGSLFDGAKTAGYAKGEGAKPTAYHGYHYRILKAQGVDAPGGAYDYVAQGRMIGGHALVAWPATYGNSGVMTFLVNHDGVVYEKDFGSDTPAAVGRITKFNPDKSWKQTDAK